MYFSSIFSFVEFCTFLCSKSKHIRVRSQQRTEATDLILDAKLNFLNCVRVCVCV